MCGIVGYVGREECADLLVNGLRRLEYRGYDSAGIAVLGPPGLRVVRCAGKIQGLAELVSREKPAGAIGIGHTRWATHGRPSDENAHPHTYQGVAVVHNGIIENHLELRAELGRKGHAFQSETDSEIFAHLIAVEVARGLGLPDAVRAALTRVKGTYALLVLSQSDPGRLVATKNSSPMVLGFADGANLVASDVPALLEHTRDVLFMEDGEIASVEAGRAQVWGPDGAEKKRAPRRVDWTPVMAEKAGHKHFMHKEIHEQPRAVVDTVRGRTSPETGDVFLDEVRLSQEEAKKLSRLVVVACGTSYHAGLVGRVLVERMAHLPVSVELASEFRHQDPIVGPDTLVVAISQSGETADTLGAVREAKSRGARVLAISNVVGSAIPRESDDALYTHAGPEIGVASTKCFTTQLAALFLLAVKLGRLRETLTVEEARQRIEELREAPGLLEKALLREEDVLPVARALVSARDVLFLGRGILYPVALEGALKLKEISYIHAEGYAAGEMKHGPIALVDEGMPVLALALPGPGYEKMIGNLEEVRARGGKVIAVVADGDELLPRLAQHVIRLPPAPPLVLPMTAVAPLQLLAYHVADLRGTDVDQPRNLAKTVTVE